MHSCFEHFCFQSCWIENSFCGVRDSVASGQNECRRRAATARNPKAICKSLQIESPLRLVLIVRVSGGLFRRIENATADRWRQRVAAELPAPVCERHPLEPRRRTSSSASAISASGPQIKERGVSSFCSPHHDIGFMLRDVPLPSHECSNSCASGSARLDAREPWCISPVRMLVLEARLHS